MKGGINNIIKPLYDLWHKVMDKLSVKDNHLMVDGKEVIVKFVVENIKALSDDICNSLQCGDIVAKKTDNQYHLYQVTYKEDKHGICLTYQAAGLQETQSYDYIDGHWFYNSEDVVNTNGMTNPMTSPNDLIIGGSNGNPSRLPIGSPGNFLKIGASGIEWADVPKLYKHIILLTGTDISNYLIVITKTSNVFNSYNDLKNDNCISLLSPNGSLWFSGGSGSDIALYSRNLDKTVEVVWLNDIEDLTITDTVTEL